MWLAPERASLLLCLLFRLVRAACMPPSKHPPPTFVGPRRCLSHPRQGPTSLDSTRFEQGVRACSPRRLQPACFCMTRPAEGGSEAEGSTGAEQARAIRDTIDDIRRGEPMTLHRAEGVAVTLLDAEEGGGGVTSVVINSTRWVVPHRVAAMLVHSTRIAGAQLRPDLVDPATRPLVESVLTWMMGQGLWRAVVEELDDLYDEVSDGMDDFYDEDEP